MTKRFDYDVGDTVTDKFGNIYKVLSIDSSHRIPVKVEIVNRKTKTYFSNDESSDCDETWLFDKNFALDVVDDGKVIFANDLTRINIYKLFIDDERFPTTPDWFVARTSEQAIMAIKNYGFPKEIAFDHDLGNDDTAINFLNFLPTYFIDNDCKFPTGFKYYIHSQNPVGKENIDSKMKQLLKYFS